MIAQTTEALDERSRTRLRWVLFAAVGLMTTGYLAALTVSTLAAKAITDSELLSGVPTAFMVVSTAVGTSALTGVVLRAGRRRSLVLGVMTAMVGSAIGAWAVFASSFPLLLVGTSLIGFGNAASHLSRYAAAELVSSRRRGTAVSLVVWAGTIGAVVGPRLLGPAGRVAEDLGAAVYAGGYGAGAVAMGLAGVVLWSMLRPDPSTLVIVDDGRPDPGDEGGRLVGPGSDTMRGALADRRVQLAVAAMVVGQFVMVLIMTATPIHVENNGFGLAVVGNIISVHTLGMFAFAPVVGKLVDRIGEEPMIAAAAGVLVASGALATIAPPDATTTLSWALFLLGLGWNFGFVAGSTLLSVATAPALRPVIQGRVDSAVWVASAAASAGSGVALAASGYRFVSLGGTALVGVLGAVLLRTWAASQRAAVESP